MIALTLAEIAAITSGTVHDAPDPSAEVTAGGMFAALPGLLKPDDAVFIKASRSVGLENFAATLALP